MSESVSQKEGGLSKLAEERSCKFSTVRWIIGINLALWMFAFSTVMLPRPEFDARYVIGAGTLVAAIMSHWAYYRNAKK